jgi:aconitate hydratase 2/2-methylisocitrate dehydratase
MELSGKHIVLGLSGGIACYKAAELCRALVKEGATVMSTSTRNFPNRLGKNTFVYLGSAELAAICSKLGRIPTREEYLTDICVINSKGAEIYKYLNFDQIESYQKVAAKV